MIVPIRPLVLLSALLALASAPPPARATATRSGPTLAVEDTLHTEVPEVLIRAPRVTLDEILDRVARGEARRDSLMRDQTYVLTSRVVRNDTRSGEPELVSESVERVYKKRPRRIRVVSLRHWEKKPDKDGEPRVRVNYRADMSEEIVNFAFRPEARRDYRYRIVGRDLTGNHLVYRIAFEPRSVLDPAAPSGLVWVDTNDFVILRQELGFERSPVPLLLKGIRRMVVERAQVDSCWVLSRVLMRAETTIPVPVLGRSFDFAIRFDQYAVNQGLADSLFVEPRR